MSVIYGNDYIFKALFCENSTTCGGGKYTGHRELRIIASRVNPLQDLISKNCNLVSWDSLMKLLGLLPAFYFVIVL